MTCSPGESAEYSTFLANGFGLDAVDQLFEHFEVDVGFEQGEANFSQRLRQCFLR